MPNDIQTCPAKARIDGEANHGIGDIDALLQAEVVQSNQQLQLGLKEVKEHLTVIAMDNHKAK